jgi:hypothetical protein
MPIGKNGTSLAELLIPQALTNAAATFVDSLKINSISEEVRSGRRIVLKRRNSRFRAGSPGFGWGVRTSFAKPAKVKGRLAKLRGVIANVGRYRTIAAKRARQRRRASISCQEIRPGIPRASSRTLAISDRAKAASPGMPRRLPTKR